VNKASTVRHRLISIAFIALAAVMWPLRGARTADCDPTFTKVIALEYPPFARAAYLQGRVELLATVSARGDVIQIQTLSGPPPLSNPARDTLSKWKFANCTSRVDNCQARFVFVFELKGAYPVGARCPTAFEADSSGTINVTSGKLTGGPIVSAGRP